jgi:hypothetical protein
MGGSLGGLFSSQGQGDVDPNTGKAAPSKLQSMLQGALKGAASGVGKNNPAPGGGVVPASPAATPVDPRYFAPSAAAPSAPGSPMTSGAPGMPQRMMPNPQPAFYGR